jgi:hypothetical protein
MRATGINRREHSNAKPNARGYGYADLATERGAYRANAAGNAGPDRNACSRACG